MIQRLRHKAQKGEWV